MKVSGNDDAELKALGEKIRQAENLQNQKKPSAVDGNAKAASVWAISGDLFGGVTAGSVSGLALDKFLGTSPWLFLVCFFMGTAAGFMMIYRRTAFDERHEEK